MKKNILLWMLLSGVSMCGVRAQNSANITMQECERAFVSNNLSLLAAKYNIDAAQAAVIQAGLWDNPSFQASFNAYNPQRKKYFDVGVNGEKAFSVQQLILLGGKRRDQVQMAQANKQMAEYEFADLLRKLKLQLRQSFFGVYYDNLSFQAISRQMANLDTLIVSYKKQVDLGNVSPKDLVRLQALYLNFKQQKSDLQTSINQSKSDLELISGLNEICPAPTEQELSVYWRKEMPPLDTLVLRAQANRPDFLESMKQIEFQRINMRLQKAQNIPDLNVGLGWDQQGASFVNAVTLSLGVPIPLLNRNQGNIKQAEAQLRAAGVNKNYLLLQLKNEVSLAARQWKDASENYQLLSSQSVEMFNTVERGVLTNFRHGNMSLIEFTDFTESYDQALLQYYKFSKTLISSCEQLNYSTNSSIF